VDIRQVDLAFNAAERITAMFVTEGDRVQTGQLLATLASERLAAKVAQAEAEVAAQRAVVARMEAGSRPEEINQARAELEFAEAQERDAERTLHRQQELARKKLASPQEVDDALAATESAAARVKAADAALVLALAGPRQEDITAAKATLRANEAQLALAQRELMDASLYAPSGGVIRNRILEPGDMASPQKPVYTLALVDPLWVRAYVDEPDLGKIRPGMTARITTDSFPGKIYPAWIGYISPTAEFTPKSVQTSEIRTSLVYQVRVFVCNPQDELRLGMPATVLIDLSQPAPPPDAVNRCPEGNGDKP
jgi:HlyD family secretion protein